MIFIGGQTGDIEYANPLRPGKTFLVTRTWRCDALPHDEHIQDNLVSTSTAGSIERDMGNVRWGAPSNERSQVDG